MLCKLQKQPATWHHFSELLSALVSELLPTCASVWAVPGRYKQAHACWHLKRTHVGGIQRAKHGPEGACEVESAEGLASRGLPIAVRNDALAVWDHQGQANLLAPAGRQMCQSRPAVSTACAWLNQVARLLDWQLAAAAVQQGTQFAYQVIITSKARAHAIHAPEQNALLHAGAEREACGTTKS